MSRNRLMICVLLVSLAGTASAKSAGQFYQEFNSDGNPGLTETEWSAGFDTADANYCIQRKGNLFTTADNNSDGVVSEEEASNFWSVVEEVPCWNEC